ncbi:MAG TPA: hypothetical protein VFB20_10885 [Burkholderiales bacterium]|nr:hypothetical protein [Burkholderiales bacterium]
MNQQHSLAAAFQSALTATRPSPAPHPPTEQSIPLLAALQPSATPMDLIVQRRIGIYPDTPGALSTSGAGTATPKAQG